MRSININKTLNTVVLTLAVLLLGASVAVAQQVNLTAAPSSLTLPDGSTVPMWGYSCGAVVTATCAPLNPNAAGGWSPVVITVPYASTGTSLTISLTNNLYFAPTTPPGATPNTIPTSIMIVGQVGGGLSNSASYVASPDNSNAQANTTWTIANTGATALPPPQGARVQSFGGEVSAVATTATPTCAVPSSKAPAAGCGTLTWSNLRPGTYLLESGTHPPIQVPMGLYGILVVTSAPASGTAGTAYPGVSYNSEIPLEFSEIDPVQNNSVNTAVYTANFSETATTATYGD